MEVIPAPATPHADMLFGLPVLAGSVPVPAATLQLLRQGVRALWDRIVAAHPEAESRPLLLSYDVHPTPRGPVLIEINTNAGGVLAAIGSAGRAKERCAGRQASSQRQRLLDLFRRDLLDGGAVGTDAVVIVDDNLARQALLPEMQGIAALLAPHVREVRLVDAAELDFTDGRLRHRGRAIDRVYWRSTDFLLADPAHAPVRRAVEEGTTVLAPSPQAYRAIADKRRLVDWSAGPPLAADPARGLEFRIAETLPMSARPLAEWYAGRGQWVFKPASGHASRGVYVGKGISRRKLAALPADGYLAQRHVPHPLIERGGEAWKYDLRFFADRGELIAAAARVFQGQVLGMRAAGSGFAPLRVEHACCLVEALRAS